MADTSIPICPLMSAGNDITMVCSQEKCAWYVQNLKKCAIYMIGHNAVLNVREKMDKNKQ